MDTTIARYIVGLIAKDLDSRRPKGMKDCSSLELERIENFLKDINSAKIITIEKWIKDKLIAISNNTDSSTPPVEGESKFVETILAAVKAVRATKLKGSITFNIPKNIDTFKVGYELSGNKDLKIDVELSNNGTDVITVKW